MITKVRRRRDETYYSEKIDGSPVNYGWPVRFDVTGRCIGITQYEGTRVKERVLLTKEQLSALMDFVLHGKHAT